MLVLRRKKSQSVQIGDAKITIGAVKGETVSLLIEAPNEVRIMRTEILEGQARIDRLVDLAIGGQHHE